uniref:Uncharacterized protein n=1 Tax=Rhizophora mucronata TaxID=61149 RepID=A0A2P2K0B1_RHIMU
MRRTRRRHNSYTAARWHIQGRAKRASGGGTRGRFRFGGGRRRGAVGISRRRRRLC